MSFGTQTLDDESISEINMTPLVDVMLVLLIIFMITLPVIQHSIPLDLPNVKNQPLIEQTKHIELTILADGSIKWDGAAINLSMLEANLKNTSRQNPQPEVHLYAEGKIAYEKVASILASLQKGGIQKIGFVTKPASQ